MSKNQVQDQIAEFEFVFNKINVSQMDGKIFNEK